MKKLALFTTLFASLAVSAGEIMVMDMPSNKISNGHVTTRYEINHRDGSAGVVATLTKRRPGRGGGHTITKHFEKLVPELSMQGGSFVLDVEGQSIVCGTMGESRVFRRPVLKLNGNCDLVTKRVSSNVGRRFQLYIRY